MSWIYNGRKYWKYRGRTYSCKIRHKRNTITDPCEKALGMTKEQFKYEMNRKYLEKFPTYEAKMKHLGLK